MPDQLKISKTYPVPMPVITSVKCVEGETIRKDGSRQPWVWYPTEDQLKRVMVVMPWKDL